MFLILLLIFVLASAVLVVFLWAGTLFFQGYIYTEPAKDLHWRAPAAAGIIGLFLTIWCALDAADPGHLDTLFSFNSSRDVSFNEFRSRKKGTKEAVLFKKKGNQFLDSQGRAWRKTMDGVVVEAVLINLDGADVEMRARLNDKGNFVREPGDAASLGHYDEAGGSRTLTSTDLEQTGVMSTARPGAFVANVVLNIAHLGVWFACLWLLLGYQWAHALGLGLAIWLALSIPGSVVNMLLNASRGAAREAATQKEASARPATAPTRCA